ncbi:TPA: MarR family transcriptional regulator [Proteus mirabilis]|nr:MarR family transcriptional regulator [Proteus mirabilis]
MKGKTITYLMLAYETERVNRKLKYVKNSNVDFNRKLHKPYRSERVLNPLMKLEAAVFFKNIKSSQREVSNAGN